MGSRLLTTGQVAKLCGVTPDAVLKWIKGGKLPAQRTAGGHYRVSREACEDLGLCAVPGEPSHPEVVEPVHPISGPVHCWEYFGENGHPRDSCLNCVVYRARAQNCYRLAEFGKEIGHRLNFCATECNECSFYRALRGLAVTILVVTRDGDLTRDLATTTEASTLSLYFVRSGYECASLIGSIRPAVIILDSDLPEVREGSLLGSIRADDRIPNSVVVVACREGDEGAVSRLGVPVTIAPFTAEQLHELVARVTRPVRRAAAGSP